MRLHACWTVPSPLPPAEDAVLSFLPCADEERLAREFRGTLLRARERADAGVRARARALYLELGAAIGAARGPSGRSLREAVGAEDGVSAWWWHPSSFKDCEADPAFGLIIAALTVLSARAELGAPELRLTGAPAALDAAFAGLPGAATGPGAPVWRPAWVWARGLAARAYSAWRRLKELHHASCVAAPRPPRGAVLFSGFWDWSAAPGPDGRMADRYAKALPAELARLGLTPGWLFWLDPDGDPSRAGRPWRDALAPLPGRADAVLLQSFLNAHDVLRAHADLRPLAAYLRRRGEDDFRALFRREGLDLFPLFDERLLRGFLDGCLPRCALVARAAERAARVLAPAATVSFLEHNPHARAFHHGIRRGAPRATTAAFQHASLCLEKTFYFMDPAREFRGEPDGLPAPCPDLLFAMGSQGRGHLLSCGYPPQRVLQTGNPRYDHLRPGAAAAPSGRPFKRLLVAASLDTSVEIDMVEAAAAAADGLTGVEVVVRDHPFSRVAAHPRFAPLAGRVRVSAATLAEDLAAADAVLFTYSTVAEEAALQGKPVWQWRPLSYDASALAEVAPIPRFATVAALRAALTRSRPEALDEAAMSAVAEKLFNRLDGGAASRVAEALAAAVRARAA